MKIARIFLLTIVASISVEANEIDKDGENNTTVGDQQTKMDHDRIKINERQTDSSTSRTQNEPAKSVQINGLNNSSNSSIDTFNVWNIMFPESKASAPSGLGLVHIEPCDLDCDRSPPEINQCCRAHKYAGGACYSGKTICKS